MTEPAEDPQDVWEPCPAYDFFRRPCALQAGHAAPHSRTPQIGRDA